MRNMLIALLALLATPALAQDPEARVVNGQKFGSWAVSCQALAMNETACLLDQKLLRSSDRMFLAQMLAFWNSTGDKRYLAAQVPVGAYLPSGFVLRVGDDGKVYNFVWQSCTNTMCEALLELDDDTFKALSAPGAQVVASYRPNLRAKPVVFRFSAEGITDGFAALKPAAKDTEKAKK